MVNELYLGALWIPGFSFIHLICYRFRRKDFPFSWTAKNFEISILILSFTAIVFPNTYLILTSTSISISPLKQLLICQTIKLSSCCLTGMLGGTSWPIFIPKHLIICKLVSIDGCQVKPKTQHFNGPLLPCWSVLRPIVFSQMFNLKYPSCS